MVSELGRTGQAPWEQAEARDGPEADQRLVSGKGEVRSDSDSDTGYRERNRPGGSLRDPEAAASAPGEVRPAPSC